MRCSVLQRIALCCTAVRTRCSSAGLDDSGVCCSALQCVAVRCNMLQHFVALQGVAAYEHTAVAQTSMTQVRVAAYCSALQVCVAACCSMLQCVAVWCIVMCCSLRKHCGGAGLDDSSVRCSVVQHVTVLYYSVLQPTNTIQHTHRHALSLSHTHAHTHVHADSAEWSDTAFLLTYFVYVHNTYVVYVYCSHDWCMCG